MNSESTLEEKLRRLGRRIGADARTRDAVMRRIETLPPPQAHGARAKWIVRSSIGLAAAACLALVFFLASAPAGGVSLPTRQQLAPAALPSGVDYAVEFIPAVAPYAVQPGLANVRGANRAGFLSDRQKQLLADNGFVILPSEKLEIYELYKPNPAPFVTTDSVFHAYQVLLSDTLKNAERAYLVETMARLVTRARARMEAVHASAAPAVRPAAGDALFYLAVAERLMRPNASPPQAVRTRVLEEVERIREARFIGKLPHDSRKRDYTLFAPTAGYESDELLRAYYRANRFLTLRPLAFDTDRGAQTCVLVALAVYTDEGARKAYKDLERFGRFVSGPAEDVTPRDVLAAARRVFGEKLTMQALADPDRCARLRKELAGLPAPTVADQPQEAPGADPLIGRGLRMLAPGVSIRARLFQDVAERGSVPPGGLHVARLLGNPAVALPGRDEDLLAGPTEALRRRAERFGEDLDLHTSSLVVLGRLSAVGGRGYPQFARNRAWRVKTANTQMAGWAELEHGLFLYLKDNAMYAGLYGMDEGFHGYVEPAVRFYADLASLTRRTRETFERMGVFDRIAAEHQPTREEELPARDHPDVYATAKHYRTLEELLLRLRDMAGKELENRPFAKPEIKLLDGFAEKLKYLAFNESNMFFAHEPMSCVVRVARDYLRPEGRYVGIGRPLKIVAVVPYGGRLHLAAGGVYSYYEFAARLDAPVTDARWRRATRQPLAFQQRRPWLVGRQLGLDRETWSARQLRDWLPRLPEDLEDYRAEHNAQQAMATEGIRRRLEPVGFVSLDSGAAALAAGAFGKRPYSRFTRAGLYVMLRNTGGDAARDAALAGLKQIQTEAGSDTDKVCSLHYGVWAYLSLRLLGDSPSGPEAIRGARRFGEYLAPHARKRQDSYPLLKDLAAMVQRLAPGRN